MGDISRLFAGHEKPVKTVRKMGDQEKSDSENQEPVEVNRLISAKTVVLIERIKLLRAAQTKHQQEESMKE